MSKTPSTTTPTTESVPTEVPAVPAKPTPQKEKVVLAREPSTLDPTRYGDWEKNGRCIDF
ncbi:MAG: DUF1674 domain-containing protein [Rhodanobacter sp.]